MKRLTLTASAISVANAGGVQGGKATFLTSFANTSSLFEPSFDLGSPPPQVILFDGEFDESAPSAILVGLIGLAADADVLALADAWQDLANQANRHRDSLGQWITGGLPGLLPEHLKSSLLAAGASADGTQTPEMHAMPGTEVAVSVSIALQDIKPM